MGGIDSELFHADIMQRMFGRVDPVRIGRYVVEHRIAEGGGGRVYRGYDPRLDRPVAIKLPLADAITEARLRREARSLAGFAHPAVVDVYDVVESAGRLALILAWVEGGTLTRWQHERHRTAQEVLDAYVAAGRGLSAVHRRRLVHRDFKPDNVLMTPSGPKLCDFGLARAPDEARRPGVMPVPGENGTITHQGAAPGTLAFMAPEQRQGLVTAHGDQYSWCLAVSNALRDIADRQGAAQLLQRIDSVLERGLAPNRKDRYPSLEALLDALQGRMRRPRWSSWAGAAAIAVFSAIGWMTGHAEAAVTPQAANVHVQIAADAVDAAVARGLEDFERARVGELSLEDAMRSLEDAYAMAHEARADEAIAVTALRLARLSYVRADLPAADSWIAAARSAIERGALHDTNVAASMYVAEGTVQMLRGDPTSSRASCRRALAIVEDTDAYTLRARALMHLGQADLADHRYEDALASLQRARALLEEHGLHTVYEYPNILAREALTLKYLGRPQGHAAVSRTLLARCPEEEERCIPGRMHALLNLAEHVPQDDWDRFEDLTTAALNVARMQRTPELRSLSRIYYKQAMRRMARGEHEKADRLLTRAIDESSEAAREFMPHLLSARAKLRIELGRFDDAARDAEDLASFGGDDGRHRADELLARIERARPAAPAPRR